LNNVLKNKKKCIDLLHLYSYPKMEYIDSKDNIEYIMTNGRINRYFSKIFSYIQLGLWKLGINIHNPINGECTPDFSCCINKTDK